MAQHPHSRHFPIRPDSAPHPPHSLLDQRLPRCIRFFFFSRCSSLSSFVLCPSAPLSLFSTPSQSSRAPSAPMSSGHYSSQAQGSSSFSDDDDDLVFQDGYQEHDHDDEDMDVDMSYLHNSNSNSNSNSNQSHFSNSMNNTSYYAAASAGNRGNTYFNSNSNAHNGMAHNASNSNHNNTTNHNNNNNNGSTSNTNGVNTGTEPKVRKKPGRKPGPTCPALRKEQNRAAQRAFRDRKERHLHQLENMIKDLKNQHFLVISKYQRDAHDLKALIESLQSENYYLREVVFAFESALSKGNHIDILKDVKNELFRRHHESRTAAAAAAADAKSTASSAPQSSSPSQPDLPATPATPGTPATPTMTSISSNSHSAASVAPTTPGSSARSVSPSVAVKPSLSPSLSSASIASPSPAVQEGSSRPTAAHHITDAEDRHEPKKQVVHEDHYSEEGIYSMSGDILYKAPPLFIPDMSSDGKLSAPTSPFEPLSVPRPTYRPPGTNLPQHTDYAKHPTVFDELQSSLFPPGTLESLHINMATPLEVVSDESLFAEPMVAEEGASGYMSVDKDSASGAKATTTESRSFKGRRSKDEQDDDDDYEDKDGDDGNDDGTEQLSKVAAAMGMKWEQVPKHRLHKELCVLVGAEPQTDPNIDPKVYEFPHDPRIDFIPCPKLRAQMIVHQHRYNADEVFQLLLDEAVCWGPPLHKDSWQLPDAFFDRFGFLLGIELERIRSKTYPPVRRQ
ncbi:unnamed protein product [Mortierella alpina]